MGDVADQVKHAVKDAAEPLIEEGQHLLDEGKAKFEEGREALEEGLGEAKDKLGKALGGNGRVDRFPITTERADHPKCKEPVMAEEKTLDDLFLDTLKDIYYAEKQIVKALPKMAKAAQSQELAAGFQKHLEETEGHVERLEQVFELLGKPARGKTCDAILGILEEGKSIMEEFKDTVALDAGLVSAAQAVEHYEIARYGTLKSLGEAARHERGREAFRRDAQRGNRDRQEALRSLARHRPTSRPPD